MSQLDRSLLWKLYDRRNNPLIVMDEVLLEATNQQLHDAVSCIDEPEFRPLRELNLKAKMEGILRQRGALDAQQQHEAMRAELEQERAERKSAQEQEKRERQAEQARETEERKAAAAVAEVRTRNRWLWTISVAAASVLIALLKAIGVF